MAGNSCADCKAQTKLSIYNFMSKVRYVKGILIYIESVMQKLHSYANSKVYYKISSTRTCCLFAERPLIDLKINGIVQSIDNPVIDIPTRSTVEMVCAISGTDYFSLDKHSCLAIHLLLIYICIYLYMLFYVFKCEYSVCILY